MTMVCIIFKYFNFRLLKFIMVLLQTAVVPFILAARKHYSIDVFTALYVVPLVFEVLCNRIPDRETSADLAKHYGIKFYLAHGSNDSFTYVVNLWGKEYSGHSLGRDELPVDISRKGHDDVVSGLTSPRLGKIRDDAGSKSSIV